MKRSLLLLFTIFTFFLVGQVNAEESINYTVEFNYNEKEYVMKGGNTVLLEDILDKINIKGQVTSYKVSNNNLFDVVKKDGLLYLESKKPFETDEWLDVVIDKKTYHIKVTDAVTATRYFGNSWFFQLKENGTLIIKVKNTPRTYDGLHQDFNSKEDWDNIWKVSPTDNTDIRPYVKKVVFEANNGVKWGFNGFKATSMFEGFENVTEYSFAGLDASEAVYLKNFFKNNKALETLDVWRFGKMPKIINMDGFIQGCSNLSYLKLDNLDNSNIGPTNNRHSITIGEPGYVTEDVARTIGAKEYGREIFGKGVYNISSAFPKLTKISAKNSNIWMVKNNRGLPGNEYYIAANDSDVLYMFDKTTTFTPDGKAAVQIDSKRDYIDLIIDRDGNTNYTYNPNISNLPDKGKNINMSGSDLNPNGAGHLAPGEYSISNSPWTEKEIEMPSSYYRIAYIGEVPFKIEGIPDEGTTSGSNTQYQIGDDLILVQTENYAWLNTTNKNNWPTSGNYTINLTTPLKFIYEDAAIDVNGKKHNVAITVTKITFKDLEKIPTWTGNERTHDGNKYVDRNPLYEDPDDPNTWGNNNDGYYYRTILQASRNDGVTFRNYVKVGEGNETPGISNDYQVLSGGSGTDVEFKVEIEGANDDTTFVFFGEDLDVAASQNWNKPNNDADYDNLPKPNSTYGLGGESFVLGNGNKLDTVTFADHTGLKLNDKTVITTGSDPATSWSEFAVKADAQGANYTWVSGIACTTYALKNTPKLNLGEIEFEPVAKVLTGRTLQNEEFEFKLTPDSTVENNQATGSAITAKNDANGNVTFGAFKFDSPKVTIDTIDYYPGTVNDATNTHGEGKHISHTYAWILEEIEGNDPDIKYDTEPRKLKIVISTPETDSEMEKGIKAEIYVNNKLVNTVWTKDVKENKYTKDVVFNNTLLKEITLKKTWDDENNKYNIRPDDLEGFITYKVGDEETTLNTDNWTKDENTWTQTFKIPSNAEVTNWGEKTTPEGYKFVKNEGNNDIYEMTNSLKKYDLTIIKEVTGNKADKNKEFKLNVKILNGNDIVSDDFIILINDKKQELTMTENGIALKIKHGDKIVIKDIKEGLKYIVTEEDTDYIEYHNVTTKDNVLIDTTKGNKVEGTLDDNHIIKFTNNNQKVDLAVPKTGDNLIHYIIMLLLSLTGLYFGFRYFKKAKAS